MPFDEHPGHDRGTADDERKEERRTAKVCGGDYPSLPVSLADDQGIRSEGDTADGCADDDEVDTPARPHYVNTEKSDL
jgi:hypothetical protein